MSKLPNSARDVVVSWTVPEEKSYQKREEEKKQVVLYSI